eukprot:1138770-Pelagomonas_calceolata.AAC.3
MLPVTGTSGTLELQKAVMLTKEQKFGRCPLQDTYAGSMQKTADLGPQITPSGNKGMKHRAAYWTGQHHYTHMADAQGAL